VPHRTRGDEDSVFGDTGSDTLKAGFGNERISGGAHRDHLFGQQGNDRVSGTNHSDAIDGGPGDDTLLGLAGNDRLFGGDDEDEVDGGIDNDTIFAVEGASDTIFGGGGSDSGELDALFDIFDGLETVL
jgi:Ca2+-binding RTX toxin-like protein